MYSSRLKDPFVDQFFDVLLALEDREECYRFFEDICTIREIQSIAQRLEVARMLENHTVYSEIAEETGASTATISRIKKCLYYGADGYKIALERLKGKEGDRK